MWSAPSILWSPRQPLCTDRLLQVQPCLHFPLADTYVQGGALLEEPGEKEDAPNGTPDAEPAELTAMGAQDAADAEAVCGSDESGLTSKCPGRGPLESREASLFPRL